MTGVLLERCNKRNNEQKHTIIVFHVENSACCNVFTVISHFLHKRGSENCVRLKLTEKDVAEYYVPQNCYFVISFEKTKFAIAKETIFNSKPKIFSDSTRFHLQSSIIYKPPPRNSQKNPYSH